MALRDGKSFLEGLRDGRRVYVDGEVVRDVTRYRPFAGIPETLASLYDLQVASPTVLGFVSPQSGELCPMAYRIPSERAHALASQRAFEQRANHTSGLLGRMPDFMSALVSDVARAQRRRVTLGARAENLIRYHALCSERDLCLTHTLIDPQVDRSRRPDELRDPDVVLRQVGETDAGIVVRGTRMLATLAPFADEIWVGPFHPWGPGEERLALCFAMPVATYVSRAIGELLEGEKIGPGGGLVGLEARVRAAVHPGDTIYVELSARMGGRTRRHYTLVELLHVVKNQHAATVAEFTEKAIFLPPDALAAAGRGPEGGSRG